MHLLPEDEHRLHRALELARAAAALASPNPAVGCVLVGGDQVLGEGAHRYDQRDHAEIAALKDAAQRGHSIQGATAYVTLEPCSHHGRTGPCAEALVTAGIGRCVVATADPNPLVRGSGLAIMRAAGMQVDVLEPTSAVAQSARRLIDAFAFSIQHGRPFVTLKAAVSADGWLAPPPGLRTHSAPHWITGAAAREEVQSLRHGSDALISGIGTVLADDPALSDRTGGTRRRRLLRVILDPALRLEPQARVVREVQGDLLVLGREGASELRAAALREAGVKVELLASVEGGLDLRAVLDLLADRQIRSVLLEAGAALNGSFLAAGLVDKVVLYRGPETLGAGSVPFAQGGPSPELLVEQLTARAEWELPHGEGRDRVVAGYLSDPWAGF